MTKTSRVTNVQVPGAAVALAVAASLPAAGQAEAAATLAPTTSGSAPANEGPSGNVIVTDNAAGSMIFGTHNPDPLDLDALRAQIRDEERAKAREELAGQIQAASTAINVGGGASAKPAHTRSDYRNMSAADIDPSTLTAPVMTRDGYLCPPAPEAKK